jgi:hypothetical protein
MTFLEKFTSQLRTYPSGIVLVLKTVESAGTVYKQSAWLQHMPYIAKYATLTLHAHHHIVHTPFCHGLVVLAKHTFARAGNVGDNKVKAIGESAEVGRIVVGNDTLHWIMPLGHACPLLHILGKDIGTLGHRFVADKERPFGKKTCKQGALATWSGTKV